MYENILNVIILNLLFIFVSHLFYLLLFMNMMFECYLKQTRKNINKKNKT